MQLRDHPLMTYRGVHTWPPIWTMISGKDKQRPRGEAGVLKEIKFTSIPPGANGDKRSYNRIFLFIDHDGQSYIGCLMLEDYAFCQQLARLFRQQYGRRIEEIGGLDLEGTL
ncbi:MAG TPA: hypothetical protein VL754_22760 [Verrucomicrobiae bacterium]|jgi:hypothetical protein|nr:hypothetical protein [Verrucomicrobiae bacterium]